MADKKIMPDQSQDQDLTDNDLEQVSGGMKGGLANNCGEKHIGNLLNGDSVKSIEVGDILANQIPATKTVKL